MNNNFFHVKCRLNSNLYIINDKTYIDVYIFNVDDIIQYENTLKGGYILNSAKNSFLNKVRIPFRYNKPYIPITTKNCKKLLMQDLKKDGLIYGNLVVDKYWENERGIGISWSFKDIVANIIYDMGS